MFVHIRSSNSKHGHGSYAWATMRFTRRREKEALRTFKSRIWQLTALRTRVSNKGKRRSPINMANNCPRVERSWTRKVQNLIHYFVYRCIYTSSEDLQLPFDNHSDSSPLSRRSLPNILFSDGSLSRNYSFHVFLLSSQPASHNQHLKWKWRAPLHKRICFVSTSPILSLITSSSWLTMNQWWIFYTRRNGWDIVVKVCDATLQIMACRSIPRKFISWSAGIYWRSETWDRS